MVPPVATFVAADWVDANVMCILKDCAGSPRIYSYGESTHVQTAVGLALLVLETSSVSPVLRPSCPLDCNSVSEPEVSPLVVSPDNGSQTLGVTVKSRMLQESASEQRGFLGGGVQPDEAVSRMTQWSCKEMFVASEQRWLFESMQQREDVVVSDAHIGNVLSDDPAMNPLGSENVSLFQRDILVQKIHAALESGTRGALGARRPSSFKRAFLAKCTASAMAGLVILPPPQRRTMKSQERPRSTSARTSATNTLLPLKVTRPWQIFGSATTYWPSSTRCGGPGSRGFLPFFMVGILCCTQQNFKLPPPQSIPQEPTCSCTARAI